MKDVPIYQKLCLTLKEASALTGIGINKLRILSEENNFTFWIGTKRMFKRKQLEQYIDKIESI